MSSASDKEAEVDWVSCLSYKSVATTRPSAQDLELLVAQARIRNRSLGVTGMLLFEDGCFFQTLEGPPSALSAVWASIQRDARHNHIEVLSKHIATARLFSGWDLLLEVTSESAQETAFARAQTPPAMTAHVERLVKLALNADDLRINAMIASFADQGWTSDAILSLLIEPAARALGDAWLGDACSEIDLTIGLSMLQLAGHAVRYSPSSQTIRNSQYRILLATAPGEQHMLGTTLLADQFLEAGWQVDMAFPESDEALTNQLNAQHPDAVDLGLSEALSRSHAIDRLRSTVKMSRKAAGNDPTVISVGGRLFAEAAATASSVGADHARTGLAGTSIRLAELVQKNRKL
jgi:methanogenic corrinoid protein MtbC1